MRLLITLFVLVLFTVDVNGSDKLPSAILELRGVKVYTKSKVMGDPYFVGVGFAKRLGYHTFLKFEYYRDSDRFSGSARVYDYSDYPPIVHSEVSRGSSYFWISELNLMRTFSRTDHGFFSIGGGFALAHRGGSGRLIDSNVKFDLRGETLLGLVVDMEILVIAQDGFPLSFRFGFSHKFLVHPDFSTTYSTPANHVSVDRGWQDTLTTTELSMAFGYVIKK